MNSALSLATLLEGISGIEDAWVLGRDGQLLDGVAAAPADEVTAAMAVVVYELERAAALLQLGAGEKVTIKGAHAAHVVALKPDAIAAVRVPARRPTADLEARLAGPGWPMRRSATPIGLPVVTLPLTDVRPARGREAVFSGQLELFGLPDLLEFLRGGQRSGRLTCHTAAGAGLVRMRRGRIISAASPSTPRLGESLIQSGVLAPDELDAVLTLQRSVPTPLGRMLIDRQLARPADVRTALLAQIEAAVCELKDWVEGTFAFEPEAPVEPTLGDVDVELDPQALLLEIFKREDELARQLV